MKNFIPTWIAAAAVLCNLPLVGAIAQSHVGTGSGSGCKQSSFGVCRTVHGRYGIYVENDGIVDDRKGELLSTAGDGELDSMIRAAGDEYDSEILGDFVVCPLSARRAPGRTKSVQFVCVRSYKRTQVIHTSRK